jgi:hypothetical protein
MSEALQIEWLLWHWGIVVHPYIDHTSEPLISLHEYGMRLGDYSND